jgi:hypothetical protein
VSGLESCGSGRGPVAGCDEHSNETSCSVNCWSFVECLRDGRFMKMKASTNWRLFVRPNVCRAATQYGEGQLDN